MELIEVIIQGKEERVLGFVYGLAGGQDFSEKVYRCQDHDISSKHHREGIAKYLGIGGKYTNFILPGSLEEPLLQALNRYGEQLGISLKDKMEVHGLTFEFKGRIYSEKIAGEVREIIEGRDEEIGLSGYEPEERVHDEAEGYELYAPEHDYELRVFGKVQGPFDAVLSFYKQLEDFSQIHTSDLECEVS